jgi:hypothetical protein
VGGIQPADFGAPRICLDLQEPNEKAFGISHTIDESDVCRGSDFITRCETGFRFGKERKVNGEIAESGDWIFRAEAVTKAIA